MAQRLLTTLDICGQLYRVLEDDDVKTGVCDYDSGTITVPVVATDRQAITVVHEILHAILDATEMSWQIRRRLKLTASQMADFEEDFLVRPLAPAIYATFRNAGWLRMSKKPNRKKKR